MAKRRHAKRDVQIIDATETNAADVVAGIIEAGGVVAIPTDTVYGLAASIRCEEAIDRLFEMKGRSPEKAIPILLSDQLEAEKIAFDLPPAGLVLARRFWPGALTLVVEARERLLDGLTSIGRRGERTVALRVPAHALARAIIARAGGVLAVTSANRSGCPPRLDAAAVERSLTYPPDAIVDGGTVSGGLASTVVRLADAEIEILRDGPVSAEELAAAVSTLPEVVRVKRVGEV